MNNTQYSLTNSLPKLSDYYYLSEEYLIAKDKMEVVSKCYQWQERDI